MSKRDVIRKLAGMSPAMKIGDKVRVIKSGEVGIVGFIGAQDEDVLGPGCSDIELNFFVLLQNGTWRPFLREDLEEVK